MDKSSLRIGRVNGLILTTIDKPHHSSKLFPPPHPIDSAQLSTNSIIHIHTVGPPTSIENIM